jgi:NIPSNAP
MDRRQLLAGFSASVLMSAQGRPEQSPSYLELRVWQLHNTAEGQSGRVSDYLKNGLGPALARAGAKLAGTFSTVIGPESPSIYTLSQYASLSAMQEAFGKLQGDAEHSRELEKLGAGQGLPFVRVESSLLRSFDAMPQAEISQGGSHPRVFELRTYESQSFLTLQRKVGMFNSSEAKIFERLGFRPVFFGETIVGPKQPNLKYMLSYESLSARDALWKSFGSDPEWKKLSSQPELKDAEIVANISNVILAPLPFSEIR